MSNVAIRIEHLSKQYKIGKHERYKALRDTLTDTVYAPFRAIASMLNGQRSAVGGQPSNNHIWALKDISFEVKRGEVVGIIGHNGAGKTTLLKILSRITEPTAGRVELYGRVSSLLEVGTGFHSELTGRENIFLNGAILGMSKAEIDRKFDQIVEFSEIEKFIDTPVKRYSSGMYVRLAFAVAAHLESDILLVDEVLAVGDATFQKKCLGKMNEVAGEGRTVLFVSHNMPMITSLTSRCILLDSGRMVAQGNTSEVVLKYYTSGTKSPAYCRFAHDSRKPGDEYVQLLSVCVLNESDQLVSEVDISEPVKIRMHFKVLKKDGIKLHPNINFFTGYGVYAFGSLMREVVNREQDRFDIGEYTAECKIPGNFLNDDTYFVGAAITSFRGTGRVHFYEPSIVSFNVKEDLEHRKEIIGKIQGPIRPSFEWTTRRLERNNDPENCVGSS